MSVPSDSDLIKPWSWNFLLELAIWFMIILIVVLIITWTRSGVDRKNLPDVTGRNVEDFAGVSSESNGPIPWFLLLFYLIVGAFMIGYPILTMIVNYKY